MNSKKIKIVMLIILINSIIILSACGGKKPNNSGLIDGKDYVSYTTKPEEGTEQESVIKKYDSTRSAILLSIDKGKSRLELKQINTDEVFYLNYTGATDVRDKFGQSLSMVQLKIGEIVDVYFNSGLRKLVKIEASNKAWEYTGVKNLVIDSSSKVMSIGSEKYSYTDNIVVSSNGKIVELSEVCDVDVLTVKGVDKRIDSIIVTKGHGYIKLVNYSYFIGGIIEIGSEVITLIKEDMIIVAPEGTYTATATKGGVGGSNEIKIERNVEISLDVSQFQGEAVRYGTVSFAITPEEAILYVDGNKTDHSDLVDLPYGSHTLKVSCDGYKDYKETIIVDSIFNKKVIVLQSVEGTTDPSETETTSGGETDTIGSTGATTGVTSDVYKIYIDAPEGAKVYFDGTYIGIAPVSFAKTTGAHMIVLTMDGYENKTYNVDISNDKEDVRFKFPNMLKLSQ